MKSAAESPAFQPLYRQIKTLITRGLVSGEWRPGEPIPSEMELAGRYGVSQGTVRKAVVELAEEKVLVRQQGKGTFVATHAGERSRFPFLSITPDGEPLAELGAQLLDLQRVRDPASARVLGIPASSGIFVLTRVLSLNGKPVCYEEVRLPAPREVAQALKLPAGLPVLRIERIAYTYAREPAELRRSFCDTREHHYRNAITG